MNVLSLFDGMSCGHLALERAGIEVENYFASEVDKYSIKVAQKNFPNTKQLGSVVDVKGDQLPNIDLLIGGSPCQGFSFAGKQLNFKDPRSKLFFEYVRLKNELNPKYFLLENVKMKSKYERVISEYLGVAPIEIDSSRVSAQHRKRLYWTNIPGVCQPKDKGILLKDIVHENVDNHLSENELKYMFDGNPKWSGANHNRLQHYMDIPNKKHKCLTANFNKGVPYNCIFQSLNEYIVPFDKTVKILDSEVRRGKISYFKKSCDNYYYKIHGKDVRLTEENEGTDTEEYLFGCITPDRLDKRQNGQRFNDGKKFYTLTAQDNHGILTEGYIRKITPIECERLQTVPDNYSACVSNSQRYRMLGNGWTVDVIAHIFKGLKENDTNKFFFNKKVQK